MSAEPLARKSDPDTSHEAAELAAITAGSQSHHLLMVFREYYPLIAKEAAQLVIDLELEAADKFESLRRRVTDLHKRELIEDTGQRRRWEKGGARCIVYRETSELRPELARLRRQG